MRKWIGLSAAALLAAALTTGCAMGGATGTKTIEGNEALAEEKYREAAELFSDAVRNKEQKVLAYRGLGMAYMGLAEYENAAAAFEEALGHTDGKMPETVRDLRLHLASACYRLKDYEETAAVCTELLSDEEGVCAEAYFLRGASLLRDGQEDEAKADFDAAAALAPSDYSLFLNIYECYEEMNLSGIGNEYLQQALGIHGDTPEDAYHRGRIYYYLENYEQAQRELTGPAEQKHEEAMYLMGQVYLALEDTAHAESMYEQIRVNFGESARRCNGLALCAMAQEKYDQALAYLQQGLALEGSAGRQELYFNEIVAYERSLDFETAKQKAQEYVEKYPSDERGQKELIFLQTR